MPHLVQDQDMQATVDVILRDGTTLRLRAPSADDVDAIVAFFAGLSVRSRFLRFHGLAAAGERFARTLVDPDWEEAGSLIGVMGDGSDARIVSVANYSRLRDRHAAEAAFAVADDVQRKGIGTRMLEQLAARAAAHGIESFVAEVLPENAAMLSVFENIGFRAARALEGGVYEVTFPIESTPGYRERVDARDHVAVSASLRPFFAPSTVAVIGASPRRGSIGGELFRNVLAGGFTGAAYPVNRSGEPVAGVRAYPSIDEIPDEIDLGVICLPAEHVLEAAEATLRSGTRALCVISAGFAETGDEGRARQEQLLALVRAHGARLVGPNCLGIASAAVGLNATFAPRSFPAGRIGFSSQSGALGLALLQRAEARGLGVSAFVSIGNKADVSSNDLLEWWEDDGGTDLVLLYVESFGNPRKFARIARRVARDKPILAMKSGRSRAGQKAAGSHTAALAGSDAAVDAVFRQAGVLRADTLGELLDVAALLSTQPVPRGRRVAVLTNAGGLGILCADACESAGLSLPQLCEDTRAALAAVMPAEASTANPVDMLGSATAESYRAALPLVLADPGIDAVIVLFVPPVAVATADVGAAVSEAAAASGTSKPVLAAILAAEGAPSTLRRAAQIPSFAYPEAAARALGRAAERAEWLRRAAGTVPHLDGIDHAAATEVVERALGGAAEAWLGPGDVRALLEAYGLPVVPELVAAGPEEAVAAAEKLGYPAVVKTAAAGVHKTESGGVALDLASAADVRAAAARIGGSVIVQPLISGGVELLAGVAQDPVFGPLVAFGPGGIHAELIGDAQFRLAPLTDVDADELVGGGKAGRLVAGFRGAPPADAAALSDVLHRLSRLAEDVPELAELDLNPVLGLEHGAVVVDARVRLARPPAPTGPKSW
ncbi:GNAT family N-acetyltransferase [Gaiella occulta]|uniref:bifunctional acetate--CoA ligase family protein/GNAT family N-acetyltransferase n=1 Tax=Gaiella occulta TaxID=1002870 RepID=UPI0015F07917|nr:GNAT family N-acetyltransferase [Gaiella occulta]